MTERGIIFQGWGVRAILAGTKTQTRRAIRFPDHFAHFTGMQYGGQRGKEKWHYFTSAGMFCHLHPPYAVGDRLWVRETWAVPQSGPLRGQIINPEMVIFAASSPSVDRRNPAIRWRPSIHMPRWGARIWLEVTEVRVQRIGEVDGSDLEAEGFPTYPFGVGSPWERFKEVWDSTNSRRGYGWDANPWVWAITFKRLEKPQA